MLNETHHAPPRYKIPELFSSLLDLDRFEAAVDSDWAEQPERAIAVRQITDRGFVLD